MAVIAILLILLALALGFAFLASGNNDPAILDFGFINVTGTTAGVFLSGAATMLVLLSGIWLSQVAARRSRRRRREVKNLREAVVSTRTAPAYDDGSRDTGTGPASVTDRDRDVR